MFSEFFRNLLEVRMWIFRGIFLFVAYCTAADMASAASIVHADMQLSNNAVLTMYQDDDGCLWIGTYDGLHMYNGKDTFVYRMDLENANSLCSNIITNIVPGDAGHVWIGTSMGVNRFSVKDRCVIGSYMMSSEVKNLVSDVNGNTLLFLRDDFISCYNPEEDRFEDVLVPGLWAADIVSVWSDAPESFCVLTSGGMLFTYRYDPGSCSIYKCSERSLDCSDIRKAAYDGGTLYYAGADGLLRRFGEGNPEVIADLSCMGDAGHSVSAICRYGDCIYIGSFGGAFCRVPAGGGECELLAEDYRVFCLLGDRNQDIVWVGTDGYGTYMYCDKTDPFSEILTPELPESIKKPVRAIHADAYGDLWIGTKGDGVIRISGYDKCRDNHPAPGQVTRFTRRDGLPAMEVFGFCPDEKHGLLWIGSSGPGLAYWSYSDEKVHKLPAGPGLDEITDVHQMCLVGDSSLFLASDGNGLLELQYHMEDGHPVADSMQCFRFSRGTMACNDFFAIEQESDSTVLLGMRGGYGLIRFNFRTHGYDFVDMHDIQSYAWGDILSVCCSNRSGVFCGSGAGLIRILPEGGLHRFGSGDGLSDNMIHGVLEDSGGHIWLSTNNGLVHYNPENDFSQRWTAPDLGVTEFCDDAYSVCPHTGRLFFGGVNGVVWIDPAVMQTEGYDPPLLFMDLEFHDRHIPLPDYNDMASELLPVVIPFGVPRFTVSFVAIDYINGGNYEYSYMLEGSGDDGWTSLEKNNRVTLSNLPPGRYRLHVRYQNGVMDCDTGTCSIPITVARPWYGTGWAIAIYVLAGIGLVVFFMFRIRRHYRLRQEKVFASLEEEQRKKLYEARMNFFVNISHELCTPLTLINGMTERISQMAGDNAELRKYADVMDTNVKGLNELVQEILDFRKIEEEGFGRVHIHSTDVAAMLSSQMKSFDDAARRNGIELQLMTPPELVWNTDRAFLKKIIFNLYSNAVKYTPENGIVSVSAHIEDDRLNIRIRNTGKGIPAEQMEHIFDRYRVLDDMDRNMYTDTASRHGLGLFICNALVKALEGEITVRSEVNAWTEFSVVLPFREEESTDTDGNEAILPSVQRSFPADVSHESETGGRKPLIMIVEDNRDITWLIADSLAARYELLAFDSADAALSALDHVSPDLVITDIIMSGKSGLDLVREIRNDRYMQGVPVIVVSAKVSDKDQVEGFASGADAYLTKPFSVPVLEATVERLLSNREMLKSWYDTPESSYMSVGGHKIHQTDKAFMDSVADVLRQHIEDENLSIDIIAGRLGLNARAFYRKFKKISGKTPSEFIKEYRFDHASRLLKTTDLTVQEVMYRVGISNKSYFYREFNARYGMKPKEYRTSAGSGKVS